MSVVDSQTSLHRESNPQPHVHSQETQSTEPRASAQHQHYDFFLMRIASLSLDTPDLTSSHSSCRFLISVAIFPSVKCLQTMLSCAAPTRVIIGDISPSLTNLSFPCLNRYCGTYSISSGYVLFSIIHSLISFVLLMSTSCRSLLVHLLRWPSSSLSIPQIGHLEFADLSHLLSNFPVPQ